MSTARPFMFNTSIRKIHAEQIRKHCIDAVMKALRNGIDPARGSDETVLCIRHDASPACGPTLITGQKVGLYTLGLLPVRCKGCGKLLTDREGA